MALIRLQLMDDKIDAKISDMVRVSFVRIIRYRHTKKKIQRWMRRKRGKKIMDRHVVNDDERWGNLTWIFLSSGEESSICFTQQNQKEKELSILFPFPFPFRPEKIREITCKANLLKSGNAHAQLPMDIHSS